MKKTNLIAASVCLLGGSLGGSLAAAETKPKPNIVVILLDDMGFSDLSCYDSEIPTPNLDALAADGLKYTQFYNTARCCPTRGSTTDQPVHIIDLMATFMDLSGGQWPVDYEGEPLVPLPGKSIRQIFSGQQRIPHEALYFQLFDHRAIIVGDYKLASDWGRPWQLFNLTADRTELNDLSMAQPKRVIGMETMWNNWAAKSGAKVRDAGGEPVYRHLHDAQEKFIGGKTDAENNENVVVKRKKNK